MADVISAYSSIAKLTISDLTTTEVASNGDIIYIPTMPTVSFNTWKGARELKTKPTVVIIDNE